jgi:phosphoglycolate phosphatase
VTAHPERGRRIRAVLFDLDGTLVDSTEDLAAAVNHARGAVGFGPAPLEAIRRMIGDGMQVLLSRAVPDPARVPAAIEAFKPYYEAHLLDRTRPYAGVEAALAELRAAGVELAVVTNKPERFSRQILEALGLATLFSAVIGGDSVHGKKPDAGPFAAALRELGGRAPGAEDALMVGDGPNDILGARAARIRSCGVSWGIADADEVRALEPDYWIEQPGELARLVLSSGSPT